MGNTSDFENGENKKRVAEEERTGAVTKRDEKTADIGCAEKRMPPALKNLLIALAVCAAILIPSMLIWRYLGDSRLILLYVFVILMVTLTVKKRLDKKKAKKSAPEQRKTETRDPRASSPAEKNPDGDAVREQESRKEPAGPGKPEFPEERLNDLTYIRDIHCSARGVWRQYDVLFAARGYGWDYMIEWADYMAKADLDHVSQVTVGGIGRDEFDVTESYEKNGRKCAGMPELEAESGILSVAGISRALHAPVKMVTFNQTNVARFFTTIDDGDAMRRYVETAVRRTFGTEDAMKLAKPVKKDYPYYLPEDAKRIAGTSERRKAIGAKSAYFDVSLKKWRISVQLDEKAEWFLTVFILESGEIEEYSLDLELAEDSHYEFADEDGVREVLRADGDDGRYLDEVFARVVKESGGYALLNRISEFITAQFHYYDED